MRSSVTRAAEAVSSMLKECAEHGFPMHEFAMHVEIGPKVEPKEGVPAIYVSDGDWSVRVAPMPYAGFRGMPKEVRNAPVLKELLATEGKSPSDLVIVCTDHDLNTGFVGYATEDFGLGPFETLQMPPGITTLPAPRHVQEARGLAATALVGLDPETASAMIHGGISSEKMTKARRVAGADWPEVEDAVSTILLAFGTPADWGDLFYRLDREKTRYGMWWLEAHGEHPAGIVLVIQNPSPLLAIECLRVGLIGEKWTAETTPNATLAKRIVPMSSTFVWYADEFFRAAEAAEKAKGT